jgi:hypothetical protein
MTLLNLTPGDTVTIRTGCGLQHTGDVVIARRMHVVLKIGGNHGPTRVATADNILRIENRTTETLQ